MSSTTKRWMQSELHKLVQQRRRYEVAGAAARTPAQRRRRTMRLVALQEEIIGHEEAISALEDQEQVEDELAWRAPTTPVRRLGTRSTPTIGASTTIMSAPPPGFRRRLAAVMGGSFAAGFVVIAGILWATGMGRPPAAMDPARIAAPGPSGVEPMPASPRPRVDDPVLAATAHGRRR